MSTGAPVSPLCSLMSNLSSSDFDSEDCNPSSSCSDDREALLQRADVLFHQAPPVPAARQAPLLDAGVVGEAQLAALAAEPPAQLMLQLLVALAGQQIELATGGALHTCSAAACLKCMNASAHAHTA